MRILLSSNGPHVPTGYGTQARGMANAFLGAGHTVDFFAWFGLQAGPLNPSGNFRVYPRISHAYGADAGLYVRRLNSDLLVTLQDIWVLPEDFAKTLSDTPWLGYFPLDCDPLPDYMLNRVLRCHYPVTFSQHAFRACLERGADVYYIPHAVDTDTFRPYDKQECRDRAGLTEDIFLVTMVAVNKGYPSRKSFPEAIEAFKHFSDRHPEARLYMHTSMKGSEAIPLDDICQAVGLDMDKVMFPDQEMLMTGAYGPDYVAQLYSMSDVLLMPSRGEGFGLPIVEAQACGCPVLTHDCTSMSELTRFGVAVPRGKPVLTPLGAYQYIPEVDAIVEGLEKHHRIRNWDREEMHQWVRENYSWQVVAPQWQSMLELVERNLS